MYSFPGLWVPEGTGIRELDAIGRSGLSGLIR